MDDRPSHGTSAALRRGVDVGPGVRCRAVPRESRRADAVGGPVSTALTLTVPPSVRPAGIVGIMRFVPGVERRCRVDVSTMDTAGPPGDPGGGGVRCIPREPNSVQVAPDWSRLQITGDRQVGGSGTAVCDGDVLFLHRATVAPQSSGGQRSPRWAGTSSTRGRWADRVLRASASEVREKPVSKGTGRAGHLRFRVMRRLD